jgi:hypothetical protein
MTIKFLRFYTLLFLFNTTGIHSQELAQITFSAGTQLSYFSLLTDREVLIRISEDGKILEWGIEVQSSRINNYYAPLLQPYAGRVEYYGPEADSVERGKVRSIGSSFITYYGIHEVKEKVGKIRSVGRLFFDYYSQFDNKAFQGKISFIGNNRIEYYSNFENEAFRGKLKSVGSTQLTWYSSFDDKFIRGKIKSIGAVNYSWYTSLDQPGAGGALKTGPFRQNTGGVVYIVQ